MPRHGSDPILPSFESFLDGINDQTDPRPVITHKDSFKSISTASATNTTSPIYAAFATSPLASPVTTPTIEQTQNLATPKPSPKSSPAIPSPPVISLHHSESTEVLSEKSTKKVHKQSSSSSFSTNSLSNSFHTSKSSTSVSSTWNLAPPNADKRKSSAFAGLSEAERDMLVAMMSALDNGDQLALSQDAFANEPKRPTLRTAQTSPPTAEKVTTSSPLPSSEDALFLYNPRMTQRFRLPSGRVVSFAEVGDREGWPVFLHLGMGCSRYFAAFFDDLAASYNLRIIAIDRPGVGHSDDVPKSELKLLSWPKVVQQVADALGIDQFSLLAHSAGSPFALATALELKDRVQGTIQLLAPWAPLSVTNSFKWLKYVPTSVIKMTNSAGIKTQALMVGKPPVHKPRRGTESEGSLSPSGLASPVTSTPPSPQPGKKSPGLGIKRSFKNLRKKAQEDAAPPLPTAVSTDQGIHSTPLSLPLSVAILRASYSESLSAGANNDLITIFERHHAFGFAYSDITHAVHIYHGSADDRIPLKAAQWMVSNMPNCSLTVLDGAGHHLMMRADVMENVMKRIATDVHAIGKCKVCHSDKKPGLIYGDYKGWCLIKEEQKAEQKSERKATA